MMAFGDEVRDGRLSFDPFDFGGGRGRSEVGVEVSEEK
jgi:hypothetical protein